MAVTKCASLQLPIPSFASGEMLGAKNVPNGDFNAEVRRAVASAGYRAAVTTSPGFNDRGSDLFALARFPTEHDLPHFAQSTSGFEQFRSRIGPPRRAVS